MTLRARLVGLFATLTTLALVAGVPGLLLALAGNPLPDSLPTLAEIRAALTTPDDGTLMLSVITWAGWIGWAVLTVAVLLEVAARAGGVRTPHMPGLALPQGAAAQLVGAAAMLFLVTPPSLAGAHATPAQPVPAVTAPVAPTARMPGWTPSAASVAAATAAPAAEATVTDETYTVRRGDSLSAIAADQLGDSGRWPELVNLNPALADDPDLIYAGTVLALPPVAHPSGESGQDRTYVVQAGDTLSAIAERELGDPGLYPLIFEANRGIAQPAGASLSDPDVIDIGWRLTILAPAHNAPPADTDAPPADDIAPPADVIAPPVDIGAPPVDNDAAIPPPVPPSTTAPGSDTDRARSQGLNGAASPRQLDRSAPEEAASARPTPEPATDAAAEDTAESDAAETVDGDPEWLVLGLTGAGALLAGSMLTTLRRRRRAGVRHRRPGRTLAAPAPVLAPIEKTLTVIGTTTAVTVDRLDQVLRRLAAAQTERHASMPALAAVQLTDTTITLVLSEPVELPQPWQASPDRHGWSIAADTALDEVGPDIEDQPAPWPLLATIGSDDDGARWLLNLEDRHLLVTGDHTYGLDLARYLAAEAATNPWSTTVILDLVGVAPELADLDPHRIRAHTHDGEDAIGACLVDAIAAVDRTRDTGRDPVTARSSLDEPDAWPARLLLVDADTHTPDLEQLLGLLHAHPGATGTSVIVTAATSSEPGATAVQVSAHGRVTVPDLGLDLIATGLTVDEAHGCAALLAHAEDPIDAPVPDLDDAAGSWARFADQAGALRAEHTLPRHTPEHDHTAPDTTAENGGVVAGSLLPDADGHYLTVGATTVQDLAVLAPGVPDTVRREVEDADPSLDDDVAMWFRGDSALPKLALLGPVKVTARGTTPTKRRPYLAELLAFIALTPNGATTAEICEAFAITGSRARDHLTTLRRWLGTNPRTGGPHIPDARKAPGSVTRGATVYQVQDLLIDLDLFRRLRTRGQARGADGIADLTTALRLVTGAPFDYPIEREAAGGWSWLISGDRHDEHARVAIVDVAHIVTTRALADGDLTTARRAAETAVLAAPYEEIPRLDLAAVAAAEGAQQEAQRIIRDEVGNRTDDDGAPPEVPERTAQILRQRHPWATTRAS